MHTETFTKFSHKTSSWTRNTLNNYYGLVSIQNEHIDLQLLVAWYWEFPLIKVLEKFKFWGYVFFLQKPFLSVTLKALNIPQIVPNQTSLNFTKLLQSHPNLISQTASGHARKRALPTLVKVNFWATLERAPDKSENWISLIAPRPNRHKYCMSAPRFAGDGQPCLLLPHAWTQTGRPGLLCSIICGLAAFVRVQKTIPAPI